ncbi:MAG TPA: tRNA epoxyqueuosine(34) reductase QueG [Stellaceae bacterium]|nr:tRNA epoxyqueuosine(34) reductase QueG [Stellaceae bacterium]
MEPRSREIKATIRARALALGFDAVGFAPASLGGAAREDLREFLRRGYHGDMGWLADRADQRAEPRALWPDASSVVVLGLNYGPELDPLAARAPMNRGEVSVYARGRDYHDVLKSKLRTLARWIAETYSTDLKLFVDTAPVMEKPIAERAGVGWQGKHTNLVSRGFGSWLFLGEIYLALELEPDAAEDDHCGECRRCLDACPTNAFPAPYRLDARRCISYLTIEHEGTIERALRPLIGNRIYGCDDCLAVCPWNKFATAGREARLRASAAASPPPLGELARLNDAEFRRRFSGSPIKRIGRDRFLRNVLIAIGNSGDRKLSEVVLPLLADHAPLVRAMAVWALRHLASPQEWHEAAAERLPTERDTAVRAEWESAD